MTLIAGAMIREIIQYHHGTEKLFFSEKRSDCKRLYDEWSPVHFVETSYRREKCSFRFLNRRKSSFDAHVLR